MFQVRGARWAMAQRQERMRESSSLTCGSTECVERCEGG